MTPVKQIAMRFFQEVCNKKNIDTIEDLVAEDVINHDPVRGEQPGMLGLKQLLSGFFSSFPDLHIHIDFMISEHDLVASRITMRGTHIGCFMDKEGSGRSFVMPGTEIFRIHNGKIVERWANFDDLSMLRQLGFIQEI